MINDLKDFSDPKKYKSPLLIKDYNTVNLKKMLKTMLLIRKTEQQLAFGRKEGLIGGPVHLGVGQEAIAVGVTVLIAGPFAKLAAYAAIGYGAWTIWKSE